MPIPNYSERTYGAIKCYFILNQGKWISAKEISEFIQGAKDLRLGVFSRGLSPIKVASILRTRLFDDLETKKLNNGTKVYKYVHKTTN